MKQEHHQFGANTFGKGANSDLDPEYLGSEDRGQYMYLENGRCYDVKGNNYSVTKIKGEEELNDSNQGADFKCIAAAFIFDYRVTFWAPESSGVPFIMIDGIVMAQHPDLGFNVNYPIQWDKNESCVGGEIFITDDNQAPLIFNIGDIISNYNAGNDKYFGSFDIDNFSVNLSAPVDKMVFQELVDSTDGLPVGNYTYSFRYVNAGGDRTNWTPETPAIGVPNNKRLGSDLMYHATTTGSAPDVTVPTPYGIKLKFRVTNIQNYESIEIRRRSWNSNVGAQFTPPGEIIGRISLSPGEISVKEFVDGDDAFDDVETVPDDEDVSQSQFIERAKAIRYYSKRLVLMNIRSSTKELDANVTIDDDNKFIKRDIGQEGHKDAYHQTYHRSYQCGERYSFAIAAFDGLAGVSFAFEDPNLKNITVPNRRDNYDTNGGYQNANLDYVSPVSCSNIDNSVTDTFEVFSMDEMQAKTNTCDFKNILREGGKFESVLLNDCDESPFDYGGFKEEGKVFADYSPYKPTYNNKSEDTWNYRVNTFVQGGRSGDPERDYQPQGFGPGYRTTGFMIDSVQNLPNWVKSFTIARSDRADRVLMQGLGMYNLIEGELEGDFSKEDNESNKDKNQMWFISPDIQYGRVNASVIDSIGSNDLYDAQMVAPLGFFSEVYNHWNDLDNARKDRLIDFISYARVYDDTNIHDFTPISDVGYDKYYNNLDSNPNVGDAGPTGTTSPFDSYDGNKLFGIRGLSQVTSGRSTFYSLNLKNNIYRYKNSFYGVDIEAPDYGDTGIIDTYQGTSWGRCWFEPWYMVNIVNDNAQVDDSNVNNYKDTGTYIKIESIIGNGNGSSISLDLVDERWQDCARGIFGSPAFGSEESYVYIEDTNGVRRPWMDVTHESSATITSIVNDITTNGSYNNSEGVDVYGVYRVSAINETDVTLHFDINGSYVPEDTFIYVQYDNRRPIEVYGGDTYIHEHIGCPIDKEANEESSIDANFAMGIGMPMMRYFITDRHYVPRNSSNPGSNVQDSRVLGDKKMCFMSHIRQMAVMFTAETPAPIHYPYSAGSDEFSVNEHFFPDVNYVMRPMKYNDDSFAGGDLDVIYTQDNNIYPGYADDYGAEYKIWKYGGFKFLPSYNQDYESDGILKYVSKPRFGYEEQTHYCTGIVWSAKRDTSQQDAPGLKTFPSENFMEISDDQGRINRAYDATTDRGDNLYAITDRGVCLLVTEKDTLTDANAGSVGYMSSDLFIARELWIDKNIGMPGEHWRSAAEGSALYMGEGGARRIETLFFTNGDSVFRMSNNSLTDIGRLDFYSELQNSLPFINTNGYSHRIAAYYDEKWNEYVLQHQYKPSKESEILERSLVFGQSINAWNGQFDFRFDNYAQGKNEVYGYRDGKEFILDRGYIINGQPIEFALTVAFSNSQAFEKEFIRIKTMGDKPERIEFLDREDDIMCKLEEATQGQLYLKDYDGWEQFIPRKDASYDSTRKRVQDRLLKYKIIHTFEDEFNVKNIIVQYKILK